MIRHVRLSVGVMCALWFAPALRAQAEQSERIAVAVVMIGPSDAASLSYAKQVQRAIDASIMVTLPVDSRLQRILSGEDVRAQSAKETWAIKMRRQLGRGEAKDAKTLQVLGQNIGVASLAIVRRIHNAPELVMFDVKNGAFFDRFVKLSNASDATIESYVSRCALASLQGLPPPPSPTAHLNPETHTDTTSLKDEPSWWEQYWPVLACAVAVGALVTAFLVVENSSDQPETVIGFNVR